MNSLERIVSFFFLGLGAVLSIIFIYVLLQYSSLTNFDSTDGVALSSELVSGGGFSASKGGGSVFRPFVSYRYIVDSHTYASSTVNLSAMVGSFDFYNGSPAWAERRLNKLVKDGKVRVFYDSENPSTSYLDNELATEFFFLPLAALVLYLLGFLLFKEKLRIAIAREDDAR